MARPPRELIAGGVYHVVARGNGGARVFRDEVDFTEYLKLLGRAVQRSSWWLLAYCLMGNHVHLVMETPEPNLPIGMQWLHGKYGRYFNDRHDGYGHLFHGRYKAMRQKTDEQLWQALRYVALNPVKAGLSKRARDYPWSSYGPVIESRSGAVAIGRLSWFLGAENDREARERYERLVEGAVSSGRL
jgi:REP element-mobilizing transposase RayT